MAADTLDEWKSALRNSNNGDICVVFIKPVVVVDGELVSAEISGEGNIEINEIDGAAMDFTYGSKQYKFQDYTVDVLKLEFFEEYIHNIEQTHQSVFDNVVKLSLGLK